VKITLIVCIVGFWATLLAQQEPNRSVRMSAGDDVHHAKLRFTTRILEGPVCHDDRLRYSLLFKFTNMGEQTVILDPFKPIVSQCMVSINEKAARARNYEVNEHRLVGFNDDSVSSASVLDESRLILLNKGASYEVAEEFSLSITDDNDKVLRPGVHVLQVVVATWYHPLSNIEWREKLRDKGYLWSDSVVSDPMPFEIPKRISSSFCK
jgi:hypothetical protein